MNIKSLVLVLLCLSGSITAQDTTYTLQDCIDIALQNNINFKASKLEVESSKINYKQNKNALLPSLNGSYNLGTSRGRSIDPFTNDFVNEELTFSNAGLALNTTIFNGFNLINRWKQSKLNLQASQMESIETKQNLILSVTLAYLQVLNARDIVMVTKTRMESTNEQLIRLKTLYEEENGDPLEYRDLEGQIANDKVSLISAQNTLKIVELDLNNLLNTKHKITAQNLQMIIAFKVYDKTLETVIADALVNIPSLKARKLRLEAAQKGIAIARAQYAPELSVFANVGTNFSSAARLFTQTSTSIQETVNFVTVEGTNLPVFTEQGNFSSEKISYGNQFDNNFNSSFGVAVNVPIFNGFKAKNNVVIEKINRDQAIIAVDLAEQEAERSITQSYNTMQTAYERYKVLESQVKAYEESFRISEIRFENGVSTSVEYISSKNNLDNALVNLATAKYEYQLGIKILDVYQAKLYFF